MFRWSTGTNVCSNRWCAFVSGRFFNGLIAVAFELESVRPGDGGFACVRPCDRCPSSQGSLRWPQQHVFLSAAVSATLCSAPGAPALTGAPTPPISKSTATDWWQCRFPGATRPTLSCHETGRPRQSRGCAGRMSMSIIRPPARSASSFFTEPRWQAVPECVDIVSVDAGSAIIFTEACAHVRPRDSLRGTLH